MKSTLMELSKGKAKKTGNEYYFAILYCKSRNEAFTQKVFINDEQYNKLQKYISQDISNMVDVYCNNNSLSLYIV